MFIRSKPSKPHHQWKCWLTLRVKIGMIFKTQNHDVEKYPDTACSHICSGISVSFQHRRRVVPVLRRHHPMTRKPAPETPTPQWSDSHAKAVTEGTHTPSGTSRRSTSSSWAHTGAASGPGACESRGREGDWRNGWGERWGWNPGMSSAGRIRNTPKRFKNGNRGGRCYHGCMTNCGSEPKKAVRGE